MSTSPKLSRTDSHTVKLFRRQLALISKRWHRHEPKYVHCTSFCSLKKSLKNNNLKHVETKQNHSSLFLCNALYFVYTDPFCSMYILDNEAAIDFASSSSRFFCICEFRHQSSYSGLGRHLSKRTS